MMAGRARSGRVAGFPYPLALPRLARLLRHQVTGRDVVRLESAQLRPGLFVHCGGRIWRHWRSELPDALRPPTDRCSASLIRGAAPRAQLSHVLRRLRTLLSPRLLFVPTGRRGGFPIALAASDGDSLLIDPEQRMLVRRFGRGNLPADQPDLRRSWARHVPAPAFEILDGGRRIREEFVEGERFHQLDTARQIRVVREVFSCYTELVAEAGPSSPKIVERLLEPQLLSHLPPLLSEHLREPTPSRDSLIALPSVPTVEDGHWGNLVIVGGHRPVFIDCFPLRILPCFYTPVSLIARGWRRSNPSSVRPAFLEGAFDPELSELFGAAGLEYVPSQHSRQTLMALALAIRDFVLVERSGVLDERALGRSAQARLVRNGLAERSAWSAPPSVSDDEHEQRGAGPGQEPGEAQDEKGPGEGDTKLAAQFTPVHRW